MADLSQEKLVAGLQENILCLVASSDEHCLLVTLNVPLALYSNRVMREMATQIYNFVHDFKAAPKDHLRDVLEELLASDEGPVVETIVSNIEALVRGGFNEQYVVNQLAKFLRQQTLKQTVVDIVKAHEAGDLDKADDVIDRYRKTSFEQFSPGTTMQEYVANLGDHDRTEVIVPTGIEQLDEQDLGLARKELHLLMAPPKRGKTFWLIHLAKQALLRRLKVVYITLEVAPEIIAGRLVQSFLSMTRRDADEAKTAFFDFDRGGRLNKIDLNPMQRLALASVKGRAKARKAFAHDSDGKATTQIARITDNLYIQSFPTGQLRIKELEAYLENLAGYRRFMPDVVLLDYADLMRVDAERYRLSLGILYKELRGIAVDRNFALATASQSNRASLDVTTITEKHAAEDFSKIAIADVVMTYSQTPMEKEMQVARMFVAVARNGPDKWAVNISQSYALGQFCLSSAKIPASEWQSALPKPRRNRQEEEEAEDE